MTSKIQVVLFMKHQRDAGHRVIIMSRSRIVGEVAVRRSVRPLSQTGDNRGRSIEEDIDLAIEARTGHGEPSAIAVSE